MSASLTLDDYLAALDRAGTRLLSDALDAGLEAAVPTCPTWDVGTLLAHQTMVHRWATANLRGDDPAQVRTQTVIRETIEDLPDYVRTGHRRLIDALRDAPADLEVMTFLNDAPAPREFWARRQAHETTIHAVDALAAARGRTPTTAETGLGSALAADGIDELVRGFFTRGASKLYDGIGYSLLVAPTDSDRRWLLEVGPSLTVAPGDPGDADPTATLTGTTSGIYLALWNRGDDVVATGRPEVLDSWRATQQVRWR